MRKMDEMELEISQKSLKFSFACVIVVLFVWSIYGLVTGTTKLPVMLLTLQFFSYLFSKMYYDKKYGIDDSEK